MNKDYNLADIKNNPEAIRRLTEFENEMGAEIGGDIVLIAYKNEQEKSND